MSNLTAVPVSLAEASAFVNEIHRHHLPVYRDKFRVGCQLDGRLVGIAQVGRPVSRYLDDGRTLEVVRCATDGTKNVCSFLYSRCARLARDMGYSRIITYILESELGTSLLASGWRLDASDVGGGLGQAVPTEGERDDRSIRIEGEIPYRKETTLGEGILKEDL